MRLLGIAAGLMALAGAAMLEQSAWVRPVLFGMGIFTGFFNVGGLAMMMDMTVEGATGMYMGLWGVAQAFGTGFSSIGSGVLHSGLIESGVMAPQVAYGGIFLAEGFAMLVAAAVLLRISVSRFRQQHAAEPDPSGSFAGDGGGFARLND